MKLHIHKWLIPILLVVGVCIPVFTQTSAITADDLLQLIESWQRDDGMDLNGDGITDRVDLFLLIRSWRGVVPPMPEPRTTIDTTSPINGEDQVAITRETIVRFSTPVDPDTVTEDSIYASFSGERLDARIHISEDARTVTLFYSPLLPASAQVRVTIDGSLMKDSEGDSIDADGDGVVGGMGIVDFQTLSLTIIEGTIVCGRVFASQLAPGNSGEQSLNEPLEGVTVTVDGMEETLFAVTDEFGNFRLEPAPAGEFFVHIDGRTAENGVPEGAYYPFVGKSWVSIPSEEVNIGNIYLPLVVDGTLQPVSADEDTVITFADGVVDQNPELNGVAITVPANSLFSDNGERGGMVGIAPVPPDRLPGELPEGLDFPIVITVQTDGATNFDTPAPICLPNLPDPVTGITLAPGEKSALWSFNHDTGRFEIVGSMTVSADGQTVCSDPGVGVLAPGWHGTRQGVNGRGGRVRSGSRGRGGSHEPGGKSHPRACPGTGRNPCPQSRDPNIDPVYLFSGEFYMDEVDFEIPGRGFNFVWSRKYRSQVGPITEMGHSWDWSYNIALGRDGENLVLLDGNSRTDEYTPNGEGAWTRNEFFNEVTQNADGTFSLFFPDQSRWNFRAIDDSPAAGKISSMADRNGNEMMFEYDEQGRLVVVIDTLDRPIGLSYNEFGFISRLEDFSGRVVQFEYYGNDEEGGNFGDLKSVTTPSITGTPNGNDFLDGKTTTYTYSTGFSDERMNHNLLTVTDGRRNDANDPTFGEGPFLVNVYADTTNPDDLNFDRVMRQVWGGGVIDLHYEPMIASPANGNAVLKSIMNDRNGNVKEYFWDERNRGVRLLEFTGRANPTEPTTNEENRPEGKLRESDPDYFDTRYEWNDDSQLKRTIFPNGNIEENIYESEINPDASTQSRGNIRIIRRTPGTHRPIGDQDVIEEYFEYDTSFGNSCCGFNFVTRHVDGNGNETLHTYDDLGNLIRTQHRIPEIVEEWEWNEFGQPSAYVWPANGSDQRRRDEYTYYTEGPQRGYMHQTISDVEGFALTTTYEYDIVGNVVRVVDPRGHDDQFVKNSLNQTVRHISRETTDGSGIRYQRDYFFDANNNINRVDIQNLDENGVEQPNSHITFAYEYEILNHVTRMSSEVDENHSVVIEYEYDANRNKILYRDGEAVAGRQTDNVVQMTYDERDLLLAEIKAPGSPDQSTTHYTYDANRNNLRIAEGVEDTPRITESIFDGYNRLLQMTDPMGNLITYRYDPNHNQVGKTILGELADEEGSENNVRLVDQTDAFDAMDRLISVERAHFDTVTQEPIGDGAQTVRYEYNENSQFTRLINDNGNSTEIAYDTLNRRSLVTDAKGNTVEYTYDENSNITSKTETDRSDSGAPEQVFTTTYEFDNLDRPIRMIDPVGNITEYGFDSRFNKVFEMDAVRTAPDAPGNVVRYVFDGMNRLLETRRPLTETGIGGATVVDEIVTTYVHDDSSRMVSLTDDNGNATVYEYDSLNRKTATRLADGTEHRFTYDVHTNLTQSVDANGTEVVYSYDLLDRMLEKRITPGEGVSDETTNELFVYDGNYRMRMGQDDDSVLMFNYDSLGNVITETLNGQTTIANYDGMNNLLSMVYPGGTVVARTYDELENLQSITKDGMPIATYHYVGATRFEQIDYGNGTRTLLGYNGIQGIPNAEGDFGQRLINQTTHLRVNGNQIFDDRRYTWNQAFHKTSRQDVTPDARNPLTHRYGYDSIYRMQESRQSDGTGAVQLVQYDLDGVGNRTEVTGGDSAGTYTLDNTSPDPADAQMNQYSSTGTDARRYDSNGNLIAIAPVGSAVEHTLAYNYLNRMVSYTDGDGTTTRYQYDVLGRRIQRSVEGQPDSAVLYFYSDGGTVSEEQTADNELLAIYIVGRELDDVVYMERTGSGYYYHTDDMLNVMKLTDASGAVVEQYEYSDYGAPSIFDEGGNPLDESAVENPYLFTGRRYDPETGFYYYRNRYMDPLAGRFTTRDPIGMWGDFDNIGNGYTYVGNDPFSMVDPLGLRRKRSLWQRFRNNTWVRAAVNIATDSEVRSAAGYEFATSYSDNAQAFANQTTFGLYKPSTIYNRDNYIKAKCRSRCFWVKYADTALMGAVSEGLEAAALPLGLVGMGEMPLEPINAMVLQDKSKLVDTDNHDLAASAAGLVVLGGKANELSKLRHFRRNFDKMMKKRVRPTKRQMAEFNKRLGSLDKAKKLTGKLNKVAGVFAVAAMLYEVNDCRKDCDKNPCAYGDVRK